MSIALERLAEERRSWRKCHPHGFIAIPSKHPDGSTNLFYWKCGIPGKRYTAWERGVYPLNMHFTDDYPYISPKCQFQQTLFHPNIYPSGAVCLSILNEEEWKPSITIEQILVLIQDLLANPNNNDPAQREPYQLLRKDQDQYWQKVRVEAEKYPYHIFWNKPKHIKDYRNDIQFINTANTLTPKAIMRIIYNDTSIERFQPYLQVLDIKKHITPNLGEIFGLILSDGDYYIKGMIAKECNYLVNKKGLKKYCIIHLYQFKYDYIDNIKSKKVCIVKRWKVLNQMIEPIKSPKQLFNASHHSNSNQWLDSNLHATFTNCEHLEHCQIIRNIGFHTAIRYVNRRLSDVNKLISKSLHTFSEVVECAILSDFLGRNSRLKQDHDINFKICRKLCKKYSNDSSVGIVCIIFCLCYGEYLFRNESKRVFKYYHKACKLGALYNGALYNNARGRLISVYMMFGKYAEALKQSKLIDERYHIPHIASVYTDLLMLYAALENKSKIQKILNLMEQNTQINHTQNVGYWIGRMRLCLLDHNYQQVTRIYVDTKEYKMDDKLELIVLYNYALLKNGNETMNDASLQLNLLSSLLEKMASGEHQISMLYSIYLYIDEYLKWTHDIDAFALMKYPHYCAYAIFALGQRLFELKRYILAKQLIFEACKTTPELPIICKYGKQWKHKVVETVQRLQCSYCNVSDVKLKACRGCCEVQYCCKWCQKKAWNDGHRTKCRNIMQGFLQRRKLNKFPKFELC